ncbi:MAG: 2-amino-4-oxopentanoate thiolase subunit OrtA [Anaerolineaceae bacterium]
MAEIKAETWVEIERVVLQPADRALTLPEDTKQVPYIMHVSGFLIEPANMGELARIRTIIGRIHEGTLIKVEPSYSHSFGKLVPELLTIGTDEESI